MHDPPLTIPLNSQTLRFGHGCFETIKLIPPNKALFLKEHISRLKHGCKVCQINRDIDFEEVDKFLENNTFSTEQTLRLIVTPEQGLYIFAEAYLERAEHTSLAVSHCWRVESSSPLNAFKSFNYLSKYLSCQQARHKGYEDALLINEREEIVESSRANIFLQKKDGSWLTPSTDCGALPGIIRDKLLMLLSAQEDIIKLDQLSEFQHIILSNSMVLIQNVAKIDKQVYQSLNLRSLKEKLLNLAQD